jgi:hypothetical protein
MISYIAKDDFYYINYLNLHNKNILRLRDFKSKEALSHLSRELNRLRTQKAYILDANNNDLFKTDLLPTIRKRIQELVIIIHENKRAKSECITYLPKDFDKLKQLHPNVEFINVHTL